MPEGGPVVSLSGLSTGLGEGRGRRVGQRHLCAFLRPRMQMPLMMPLQLHHREALSSRPQFLHGGCVERARGRVAAGAGWVRPHIVGASCLS